MKLLVNILLIIVILAAIVIPSRPCQEETSTNKTSTNETSTDKTPTDEWAILKSIIVAPNRNIVPACLEGQRKDQDGNCRNII